MNSRFKFEKPFSQQGFGDVQREILQKVTDSNLFPHLREKITTAVSYIYADILRLREAKTCVVTWDVFLHMVSDAGVTSDEDVNKTTRMLECRVRRHLLTHSH